ncbi:hypothetical protein LJC32_06925 [Oscillospiraceae bacterium OttesenSCG-928-F05]|nr:hypothetical protein [Oscillospiraceae bacterium OttesenSCG-928-F05]
MRYRKLDDDGDYMLGRREQFYVDREAVAQAVKTRLQLLLGEWWENTEDGLPLFQQILNTFHAPDQRAEQIDLIFSERILGTQGVSEILSFDSSIDMDTRTYSAECRIQTEYGESFTLQVSGGSSLDITI